VTHSEEYRRQIMRDLAQGDKEMMPDKPAEDYTDFDDFARRSSPQQRRQLFGQTLHHDNIPPSQMEPELQKAISQIQPNQRHDVAKEFFKKLKERGLSETQLEQQLGLSTHNPNRMTADDVSKLASFSYHAHPDIFREVLADKPDLMKFLGNPIVAAIVGGIALKWLTSRK
jgi:hypothetical protein